MNAETIRAEHYLDKLRTDAYGFEDACDVHGENCPVPSGGKCRHYCEVFTLWSDAKASEAGLHAFVLGRVYEVDGSTLTIWPFADCVPVRA